MNTIYKVHVTKKEEEEVQCMNKKKGAHRQIGKNIHCALTFVTGCESKTDGICSAQE